MNLLGFVARMFEIIAGRGWQGMHIPLRQRGPGENESIVLMPLSAGARRLTLFIGVTLLPLPPQGRSTCWGNW